MRGPNGIDKKIGKRLRQARKDVGLSLQAVANAKGVNLTYQSLQKYEAGKTRISVSVLLPIVRALGMTAGQFLEGI